jgi:hypothetical protein
LACNIRPPFNGYAETFINGTVSMGTRVDGATVTATSLDDPNFVVGTGVTDVNGNYRLSSRRKSGEMTVYLYQGDAMICATGGTVVDIASGVRVPMGDIELCSVIEGLDDGEFIVNISPWSTLAVARMRYLMQRAKLDPPESWHQGARAVADYIGCANPGVAATELLIADTADPTKTTEGGTGTLGTAEILGIIEGGRSMSARMVSEHLGLQPGTRINTVTLLQTMIDDLTADGLLDGADTLGPLDIRGYPMTASFYRADPLGLVQGLRHFVLDPANATGFGLADVKDLLACLPATQSPIVLGAPEEIDVIAPVVEFLAPRDGDVVASSVAVLLQATDDEAVKVIEVTQGLQCLDAVTTEITDLSATVAATLDVGNLADGEVHLAATAADAAANVGTAEITVIIDRSVPVVRIVKPAPGEVLSGIVEIEVEAEDPHAIASLMITSPSGEGDVDLTNGTVVVTWDTTLELDGPYIISASAYDTVGNGPGVTSTTVMLDNLSEGRISGVVALESPLVGAIVYAQPLDPETRTIKPSVAQAVTAEDGSYNLTMPDNLGGSFVLTAKGTASTYRSAATGALVTFDSSDELRTAVKYTPSIDGTVIRDVNIHGVTTLIVARALADTVEWEAAVTRAASLFSAHYQVDNAMVIAPASMLEDATAANDGAQKIGLLHAGWAYLGGRVAVTEGVALTALPTTKVVERLVVDLGNLILDGRDGGQRTIYFTPEHQEKVRTDTCRIDQAQAIAEWLEEAPLGGAIVENLSGLRVDQYDSPSGWLWDMAGDTEEELFGPEAPKPFDFAGPEMTSTLTPPCSAAPVRGLVKLSVVATDPSGIRDVTTKIDGASSGAIAFQDGLLPGFVIGTIDTTLMLDGHHTITVSATDLANNLTESDLDLWVDNTRPTVEFVAPELTNKTTVDLVVTARDNTAVVAVTVSVGNEQLPVIVPSSEQFTLPVSIVCNASTVVSITATDSAGNEPTEPAMHTIHCDNIPPKLVRQKSSYVPENKVTATYGANGVITYTTPSGQDQDLAAFPWTPISKLVKYFNRLDEGSDNLPSIALTAVDEGPSGAPYTPSEELVVEYRYFSGTTLRRDWSPAYVVATAPLLQIVIPISYQALSDNLADSLTSPNMTHRVEVRVLDSAGNIGPGPTPPSGSDDGLFEFELALRAPPIWYSDCQLESQIEDYRVADHTLELLFRAGAAVPFGRGSLKWDLGPTFVGLPQLEANNVLLKLAPARVRIEVPSITVTKEVISGFVTDCGGGGLGPCTCILPPYDFDESHQLSPTWSPTLPCISGFYPMGWHTVDQPYAPDVEEAQVAVKSAGYGIEPDANGKFPLAASSLRMGKVVISETLAQPTLSLSGEGLTSYLYPWEQGPSGYVMPGEPKFVIDVRRLPWLEPGQFSDRGQTAKYRLSRLMRAMSFFGEIFSISASLGTKTIEIQRSPTCAAELVYLAD